MPILRTSFGCLRPWKQTDVNNLQTYANNPKIGANLRDGFNYPYTRQSAEAFLQMATQMDPPRFYAITWGESEDAIGSIGISPNQNVHRLTAELGYWLAEPFWGKSIMTETVRVFCDFCMNEFHLVRIFADPYSSNPASARVLEKAGFQYEGRLQASVIKNGRILDQLMYALVRLPDDNPA